ncbi:CU044_5270 family protein [Spirillospora sp. NPDC127200]
MKNDSERAFADLRPAALDEMADDAFARRRDADLAHAMRAVPGKAARSRRPMLLVAGLTAGAVALGGAVVLADDDPVTPRPQAAEEALDARSVLLASAQKAAQAPAATGRYWYQRKRVTTRIQFVLEKRPGRPAARKPLPFTAYAEDTREHWLARDQKDLTRASTGIDSKIVFAAPADEAEWRKMGSPKLDLWLRKHHVNDHRDMLTVMLGYKRVGFADLAGLPGDAAGLEAELRRRFEVALKDRKEPYRHDFTEFVWQAAHELLPGPVPPAVRAALYRVLAKQPRLRAAGRVKDAKGRPGVVISMPIDMGSGAGTAQDRLIISPETGRLLATDVRQEGKTRVSVVHEDSGWANARGERP